MNIASGETQTGVTPSSLVFYCCLNKRIMRVREPGSSRMKRN